MSSGEEAWQHLHKRDEPFYAALGRRCLHIGSERDLEMREGLDLDFVETPEEADFILNTGPAEWDDTIEDYAPVLADGARAATCRWSAPTPISSCMHGGKPALCAGALAEQYEALGGRCAGTASRTARSTTAASACSGSPTARRILAIGDSLRTDIAGAAGAGIDEPADRRRGIHARRIQHAMARLDLDRIEAALAREPASTRSASRLRFVW